MSVTIAATISYWTALAYNFALNKLWTFGITESIERHALLYGTLVLINYLSSLGIIYLLGTIGINYAIAKIVSVGLAMSWNYIAYKKYIFT